MADARSEHVSDRAKERQRREMGTLGSGNHYLEVQAVVEIFDTAVAEVFGLARDDVVVTIHCGSRGLGHQIGTEFLKEMVVTAEASGIALPDRELACAPINSEVGQRYLGAMRAAPFEVHRVGDFVTPRRAHAAVIEGHRVAVAL